VLADRRLRYRQLADGALPLVRDIAAGRADPRATGVRRRCALEAAALRRSLVDGGQPTALGDLLPVIESAQKRGLIVDVQANGRLAGAPASVREEIARHVADVLDRVSDGRVLLTAMCQEDAVDVYLTYPAPAGTGPGPPGPREGPLDPPGPDGPDGLDGLGGPAGPAPDRPPDRRQPRPWTARCTAVDEIEDGRGVLEVRWSK
jgi:hypothetical protein